MQKNQKGFSHIAIVLFALIAVVVVGSGWYVWKQNHKSSNPETNNTQQAADPTTKLKDTDEQIAVTNYYDCLDEMIAKTGHSGITCEKAGKTYTIPKEFTVDMIRGYYDLPEEARAVTEGIAKSIFICGPSVNDRLPSYVAIKKVSDNKFAYLSVSCDSGHAEIIAKTSDGWKSVVKTQGDIPCSAVNTYKIPKTVFEYDGSVFDGKCIDPSGGEQAWPI